MQLINTKKALQRFAKHVVSQSRANLTRRKKNSSKTLWNSIEGNVKVSPNSFSLKLLMEDYGVFQDRGVKGIKKGTSLGSFDGKKASFSYKSKGGKRGLKGMPPPKAFDKWNIIRGRAERDERGRFLTRKQLNFKTARSIFYYGIKPSLFFTKPFKSAFKNLPEELIEAYGLDIDEFLKFTTK
jgi:hypothetical protein